MDEKQIKLLWDLDAKNGGFSSYDEFRTLMQNDNARKAYFDDSNKDLGFKDYDEFETTLGIKKKEDVLSSAGSYGTPSQMGTLIGGAVGTLNGSSQKLNGNNIGPYGVQLQHPVNVDDDPVKFALSPYRVAANKALNDLNNVDVSANEGIGAIGDLGIKLDISRSGLLRDDYNKKAKALEQAEQQSNNLFGTTGNAYNYLIKKKNENGGILPDDNETVNLALRKVSNAQAIDDLWKKTGVYTDANKNIENFAFNLIEGKNSDNAPEAKRGEFVYEALNDPTVVERASLNPEFNKAFRSANANIYNHYPSFANKKIGQDLAQVMEDNKMINTLYDNPGTEKTDKAANLLLKEGKWGNREYSYYTRNVRPIIERGDADKIIPLTDIAHQAGYAIYEGTKGYNQSIRDAINFLGGNFLDKNGNSLWQNLGLLESNQNERKRKEQEKYSTPFVEPKGMKAYVEAPINMAAGIAPMILGGMIGVPSSVNMALQFGSDNAEKANEIFPGNDIKSRANRFAYTLASTSIDMTLMDLLPVNKLFEAKRALEPTIKGVVRSLANGDISRAEVKPLLLDKLGNYLKTVPKNLIKNANVLTVYNYAHTGLGALAGDRNIKAEEIGQNLIGDYLNNLLAGSALSLIHFKPGDKPRFEEAQYLKFANNYGTYKNILENRLKERPEESVSINEKLDNLLYLKNVKDGMNPDMSDKKKARLLTISLKEKVLKDAKKAMPDQELFDNSKIDELKKQKEEVLNSEEHQEEKVEPIESERVNKLPETDDEWKQRIATAPDEATKDELMKQHGEWLIAQKRVSDKTKKKLSDFKFEEEQTPTDIHEESKNNSNLDKTQKDVQLADHPTEHEFAASKLTDKDNLEQEPNVKAIESTAENTDGASSKELEQANERATGLKTEGDKRQQSLFHTTESESPKLTQMKDIVKDLVDEGYTNLSDIHEIVARETKNDSPKLKQLVEDAYNEYGKDSESTPKEVTSGVIGRVSKWINNVLGGKQSDKVKVLSPKDDADFERRVREEAEKEDGDVLFHKSPEGKILGATIGGKVYLNGNHINPNTPIHEAGHIWVEVAKQHTPEIYDRGIKLVSDADNPYLQKVKSSEFYKSEAAKAGKEGSPEYEQYMQHEALSMAIGDKGAQFVTEAKKSAFKEWLSNLWDMVKKAAGFKDITSEELQNLTFDEFTKRAARDILQGEVPQQESGGIRHADTKIIRERHGIEPYEREPQTEEQWNQEAERRIKENPDIANELLDRIDKSQRNEELGFHSKLDTDEADQKILDIHVNKLDKELQSNPSPEKLQELRRAVSLADYSGTKLGRELRSRRGSGLPMDSLGQFLLNKENAQGANLTDKQIIEQSEKYQELKKAHDEFKEAYEREKAEKEKLQIENDILKKGNKGNNTKKTKSDYVSERKSLIDILKKQKQEHEDWLKEQGIQKMGFGITLTTDMTKTILKIAKSYAEEGVGKLETLVDKVGEALKDVFPEITNSDILDVLGNKYKTQEHEKTRAEHKNVLKSLRKEAELIRKIADARKVIQNEKNERTKAQKTKRIQELEEQYNKIKANNEKEFSEEDLQNSLMDRIRKVSQDLKTKNFLKEKPKNKVNIFEKLSPKTTKLQDHLISLQVKRDVELYKDQLSKRTKWQKGWDIVQNVLGIKRLAQTSIDVSLLGRQLSTVTKNPRRWKHVPKIVRGTLLSFVNPKVFNRIMFNIKSDPDYQQILKDGLHFIEFESPDVERRSDLFPMKSFLYDVPYLRKPFLASNRAADAAANIARYELYKQGEKRLIDQKITRQDHPEEYEGLARWVNTITGSGKMLKFIEESHGAKKFLGNTLYGAKLMASRFNMLSPKYWAKLPPAVRREAIKDMISFTGTLMAMGMAARIAGARVSLNPNDSEFLKIRIGNNVYDITGGIGNYVRMFLRLSGLIISRGKYLTGNMGERENERNIGRGLTSLNTFVQSKLAPNTSFALSALTGKNAIGQPFDPYDVIRAYPMYFDDVWDGFKDSGFTSLFTVLLPSLEGEGVNVYPPRDANFSQEFKDNTVIKYYTDKWGMQLPNVRLENQKVPNTKKTIDEYPKEKQDEYIKVHNNELLKILTYIKNRGYVYKSEEDNISLYGNPGDEQIRLDDLNDDWDRGRVMSLAQRRASLLAKRKVFGR